MSYEPLHHKYRPQTFAQLVGQEAIAATLSNALRQQRIAPAYLFTGPRGTGKTSSARILAKSLNCTSSDEPTDSPCGICEICRRVARGSALDVIEIDAASNTGVDNIRELIERAQFAPVQCRFKVYIIDEVHMLSTAAFNALLKTLEEPPNRVVFVLATTDPQRVLPTIISRCQRFDYRRIPLDAMVSHLMAIAQKESIAAQPEAVELVAQIAQGGLRDAESLLDQLSLLEGEISVEKVWDLVGAVPERDLLALVRAIAQDNSTTVLDQARHLMNRGREPLIVLQNLASFYRDLLIAKTASDRRDLVTLTQPTWKELCDFAQTLDMATILLGQQHLRASEVQVKNTTQPRLWLEITLLGLLPSTINSQSQAQAGASNSQRAIAPPSPISAPTSRPQPAPPAPLSSPPVSPAQPVSPQRKNTPEPASPSSNPASESFSHTPVQDEEEKAVSKSASLDKQEGDRAEHPAQPSPQPDSAADPLANNQGYAAFQQEKLDQVWQQVMAAIPRPGTQALLQQWGCLVSFNGSAARVGIRSQPLMRMAQSKLSDIENAFEQIFGKAVGITLEVSTAHPESAESSLDAAAAAPPSSHLEPSPYPETSAPTHPPTPAPQEPAPVTPPATAPASSAATISSDSEPRFEPPPFSWKDKDEVTKAAESLAQMFNGAIVSLDEDDEVEVEDETSSDSSAVSLPQPPSSPPPPLEDDDDDDVPF